MGGASRDYLWRKAVRRRGPRWSPVVIFAACSRCKSGYMGSNDRVNATVDLVGVLRSSRPHPLQKSQKGRPPWGSLLAKGCATRPSKPKLKIPRAKPARGAPEFISMTNIWATRPRHQRFTGRFAVCRLESSSNLRGCRLGLNKVDMYHSGALTTVSLFQVIGRVTATDVP
jgi:hypothetical protein